MKYVLFSIIFIEVITSEADHIISWSPFNSLNKSGCYFTRSNGLNESIFDYFNPALNEYKISLNDEDINFIDVNSCDFKGKKVYLSLSYNKLKELKITNKDIVFLKLTYNENLDFVELKNLPYLKEVILHSSKVKELIIENVPHLESLDMSKLTVNSLKLFNYKLDIFINSELESLSCIKCQGKIFELKEANLENLDLSEDFEYEVYKFTKVKIGSLSYSNRSLNQHSIEIENSFIDSIIIQENTQINKLVLRYSDIKTLEIKTNKINEIVYELDIYSRKNHFYINLSGSPYYSKLIISILNELLIEKLVFNSNNKIQLSNTNKKIMVKKLDTGYINNVAEFADLSETEALIIYDTSNINLKDKSNIKYIELKNQPVFNYSAPGRHEYKFDFPNLERIDILNDFKKIEFINLKSNLEINYEFTQINKNFNLIIYLRGEFSNLPTINGNLSTTHIEIVPLSLSFMNFFNRLQKNEDDLVSEDFKISYYNLQNKAKRITADYELLELTKGTDEYTGLKNRCPLCNQRYKVNEKIVKQACIHLIHLECFNKINDKTSCPICLIDNKNRKTYRMISASLGMFKLLKLQDY